MERVRKEAAAYDLRQLRVIHTAIAAVMDKKGAAHFKKVERQLEDALLDEDKRNDERRKRALSNLSRIVNG